MATKRFLTPSPKPKPSSPGSPACAAADPAHVAVFACAHRKMWDEIEAGRLVPWTQTMAAAARAGRNTAST